MSVKLQFAHGHHSYFRRDFQMLLANKKGEIYEGHSRINDNEFISRKVLLESVFFCYVIWGHIYYLLMPGIWCIYHG